MAKTNLQKWCAYMKKTPPESVLAPLPVPTSGDVGKVLVVDSNGKPTWGNATEGGIPLGENESIGVFKE